LGCAYLLNGEYYKAIAVLKDAEKLAPQDKGLQNNLGVAYYMVENVAKAKKTLEELYAPQKENLTALYNLGFIAYFEKDRAAAEQYFDKYLAVDKGTYWAFRIDKALGRKENQKDSGMISDLPDETVYGTEPGSFEDEVPANWGKPLFSKIINSTEIPYLVNLYDNGIKTVSQDDEIVLIVLNEKYTDKTADGIKIGSSRNEVLKTYGNPSDNYNLSIGQTMIYQNIGISFHIQDEKIAGWLLFLN
jgi:tetratricopeptide (TPR) repeat protein